MSIRSRLAKIERKHPSAYCPHLGPVVIYPPGYESHGPPPDTRECPCGRERLIIKVVYVDLPVNGTEWHPVA